MKDADMDVYVPPVEENISVNHAKRLARWEKEM